MSKRDSFIEKIKREANNTKKMLERVPEEKFGWKPHEKSMSLKSLAIHIASLSGLPATIAETDTLDLAANGIPRPEINSNQDLVNFFDQGVTNAVEALKQIDDSDLTATWTMRKGDFVIIQAPREFALQTMALDHMIHHRGQLSVYLRLLDVPVPGMFGPSADDRGWEEHGGNNISE